MNPVLVPPLHILLHLAVSLCLTTVKRMMYLVREGLRAYSIIPARYPHVPIWRTHGRYRQQIKRGYSKPLYNQRNKDEPIMSVIKRLSGEHVTSRSVRTQNRELSFRCIAYNMHRVTSLFLLLMVSTEP